MAKANYCDFDVTPSETWQLRLTRVSFYDKILVFLIYICSFGLSISFQRPALVRPSSIG